LGGRGIKGGGETDIGPRRGEVNRGTKWEYKEGVRGS